MQSLPLEAKIIKTQQRIKEWYEYWGGDVYISFSGGKDSTVLLDIVRQIYPDTPAVFSDTGLEYPEIRKFVKTKDNVIWVKPRITFKETLDIYGYPIISKKIARMVRDLRKPDKVNANTKHLILTGYNQKGQYRQFYKIPNKWLYLKDAPFKISEECCKIMKKDPIKEYEKITKQKPYVGTMADDSQWRKKVYLKNGCNSFNGSLKISQPLGFWTEQDILKYILKYQISYCSIYGDIIENEGILKTSKLDRTGCMFCMFGIHMEGSPNRFQQMKLTHPKQYEYCMNKLGIKQILEYINIPYE